MKKYLAGIFILSALAMTPDFSSAVTLGGVTDSVSYYPIATTSAQLPLAISSLSPTSGPVGTIVTIKGSGFTGDTKITFGGSTIQASVGKYIGVSTDGTSMTFTVPSLTSTCPAGVTCISAGQPVKAGVYAVTVSNANGTSNAVNFKVTDGSPIACPFFSPPSPDFCKGGTILPGENDTNGCPQPPTCKPGASSVSISSLSPTSGPVGTRVVMKGSGLITGSEVRFGDSIAEIIKTTSIEGGNSGTGITFVVPSYFSACPANVSCVWAGQPVKAGVYAVTVSNANGTSNKSMFTVISSTNNSGKEPQKPTSDSSTTTLSVFDPSSYAQLIEQLMKQVAELQAQLKLLKSGGQAGQCLAFSGNLSLGDGEGDQLAGDVKKLQSYLKGKGIYNANITGYFGKYTKAALIKLQKSIGIEQTGELDGSTIEKLNADCR